MTMGVEYVDEGEETMVEREEQMNEAELILTLTMIYTTNCRMRNEMTAKGGEIYVSTRA